MTATNPSPRSAVSAQQSSPGKATLPALVDDALNQAGQHELALIEYIVGEDLSPIEQARRLSVLLDDLSPLLDSSLPSTPKTESRCGQSATPATPPNQARASAQIEFDAPLPRGDANPVVTEAERPIEAPTPVRDTDEPPDVALLGVPTATSGNGVYDRFGGATGDVRRCRRKQARPSRPYAVAHPQPSCTSRRRRQREHTGTQRQQNLVTHCPTP